ncbi:MAG: VanZ family protein [Saprospiraceae bacterium]|nr:VanZ family protein [Saprospiraceae bacterium]
MLKAFFPAIVWSLIILGLSTMPGVSLPQSWADLISFDKLAHLVVYALLSFLVLRALSKIEGLNRKNLVKTLVFCGLYGILMESIQYGFFPDRYFEVLDIIANIIGSFIGAWMFYYLHRKKPVAR